MFLGIIIALWRKIKVKTKSINNFTRFNKYGQFILLVYIFNGFTDVLDLDASTMMFTWLIFSLLIVSKRLMVNIPETPDD